MLHRRLQEKLPTYSSQPGEEPTPEGLFWLLMTGEVPTKAQADALTAELHERAQVSNAAFSSDATNQAAPHTLRPRLTRATHPPAPQLPSHVETMIRSFPKGM